MKPEKETVLFSYLWEQMVANEWALAMGENASKYSLLKTKVLVKPKARNPAIKGPESFSDFFRQIYYKYIRQFPLFSHMGEEYLEKLDRLHDEAYRKSKLHLFIATKIDALAVGKYYTSVWYYVGREEIYRISKNPNPARPLIYNRYNYPKERAINSFSLTRKFGQMPSDKNRQKRFMRFVDSWRRATRAINPVKNYIIKNNTGWWELIEKFPDFDRIEPEFKELVKSVISAIMHLVDNILDDPVRIRMMYNILKKIPVSLLVMSVKVVNPAPFVEQCVKIFLWQPKAGVWSLLQRMSCYLCAYDETKAAKERLEKNGAKAHKDIVKSIMAMGLLSSNDSDAKYMDALKNQGVSNAEEILPYLRISIRLKEKTDFVDFLADKSMYDLFVHIVHFVPKFLNEIKHVMSVSEFLDKWFFFLESMLEVMTKNEKMNRGNEEQIRQEIIGGMFKETYQFVKWFYPILNKTAKYRNANHKKTPYMLVDLADYLVRHLVHAGVGLGHKKHVEMHYHSDVLKHVQSLGPEKSAAVWREIDQITECSEKGIDEFHWPETRAINKEVLPFAYDEFMKFTQ